MTDRRVFLVLVVGLVVALLTCLAGIIGLSAQDKTVPGVLENVTVGLMTGLLGVFTVRPGRDEPVETRVVNTPAEAVPVDPA